MSEPGNRQPLTADEFLAMADDAESAAPFGAAGGSSSLDDGLEDLIDVTEEHQVAEHAVADEQQAEQHHNEGEAAEEEATAPTAAVPAMPPPEFEQSDELVLEPTAPMPIITDTDTATTNADADADAGYAAASHSEPESAFPTVAPFYDDEPTAIHPADGSADIDREDSADIDHEPAAAPPLDAPVVGAALAGAAVDEPAPLDGPSSPVGPPPGARRRTDGGGRGHGLRTAALAVVGLGLVLVAAWGVDTARHRGQAMRGVTIDGVGVAGMDRGQLTEVAEAKNRELGQAPVTIQVGGASVATDAATLGAEVAVDTVVDEALAARRDSFFLLRPLSWAAGLFSTTDVPLTYRYDEAVTAKAAEETVAPQLEAPVEPELDLVDDELVATQGADGITVNPRELVGRLGPAIEGGTPYFIDLEPVPAQPLLDQSQVDTLAADLNLQTSQPLTIKVLDDTAVVPPAQLRSWVQLGATDDGAATWTIDETLVLDELRPLFPSLGSEDQLAHFKVVDDVPMIIPASETVVCCAEGSAARISDGIDQALADIADPDEAGPDDYRSVTLEPIVVGADEGVAELESLGIIEQVSTFTTNHPCCANRVKNIHRFADIMQGAIIRPGETISLNETVGRRTIEKGFFSDGALAYGQHVENVGGGVSQYATTFFNASFYAGLEFVEYQSHSLYFSRYPKGREATISWTKPDLKVRNNTPYGVLVWNTYTDTSLTVSFYSTKHLSVQDLPLVVSKDRYCTIYTTPRVITYDDGRVEEDRVRASYRPGEALDCNNNSTLPPEEQPDAAPPPTTVTTAGGAGAAGGDAGGDGADAGAPADGDAGTATTAPPADGG